MHALKGSCILQFPLPSLIFLIHFMHNFSEFILINVSCGLEEITNEKDSEKYILKLLIM